MPSYPYEPGCESLTDSLLTPGMDNTRHFYSITAVAGTVWMEPSISIPKPRSTVVPRLGWRWWCRTSDTRGITWKVQTVLLLVDEWYLSTVRNSSPRDSTSVQPFGWTLSRTWVSSHLLGQTSGHKRLVNLTSACLNQPSVGSGCKVITQDAWTRGVTWNWDHKMEAIDGLGKSKGMQKSVIMRRFLLPYPLPQDRLEVACRGNVRTKWREG